MGFIIGILTVALVLDCIVLVFLVLIQLPKKEAGAGLAFGGAASDALFGAGSGTVLTRITRYAATAFFIGAILLSYLQMHFSGRGLSSFGKQLMNPNAPLPMGAPVRPGATPAAPAPTNQSIPLLQSTNVSAPPLPSTTNVAPPTAPGTNTPSPTK